MDEVDRTGAPIVVTKRGRAVAQLAPIIDPIDVTWNAGK